MRIASAHVAGALTLGLAETLAPAQAASQPGSGSSQAAPVQATAKKDPTKLTAKTLTKKVTVGKKVTYTGTLKRKTGKGYKSYKDGTL